MHNDDVGCIANPTLAAEHALVANGGTMGNVRIIRHMSTHNNDMVNAGTTDNAAPITGSLVHNPNTNNPPHDPEDDDKLFQSLFKRADSDDKLAARVALSATAKCALAVLTFYAARHPDTDQNHTTMWKLDSRVGPMHDKARFDLFNEDMRKTLNIHKLAKPASGAVLNETQVAANNDILRMQKLLKRGFEMACDLVMSDSPDTGYSAAYALSWFHEGKGTGNAQFIVPYAKLVKRHHSLVGVLHDRVNGNEKAKPPIKADPGLMVALDGKTYSTMDENGMYVFDATHNHVGAVAKSHRVVEVKKVETDPATGKDKVVIKEEPATPTNSRMTQAQRDEADRIERAKQAKLRAASEEAGRKNLEDIKKNAPGQGRPDGSANDQPGGNKPSFQACMNEMLVIMKQDDTTNEKAADNYWSNHPDRDQMNNLIAAMIEYRLRHIRLEIAHCTELKKPKPVFAKAELITVPMEVITVKPSTKTA